MSTTFDVFPSTNIMPTFRQLLDRSTVELHRFLSSHKINSRPQIDVRIQRKDNDLPIPFDLNSQLSWPDETYAWFHIADIPGGTDASFFGQSMTSQWSAGRN